MGADGGKGLGSVAAVTVVRQVPGGRPLAALSSAPQIVTT